jgi:hypothetical protein
MKKYNGDRNSGIGYKQNKKKTKKIHANNIRTKFTVQHACIYTAHEWQSKMRTKIQNFKFWLMAGLGLSDQNRAQATAQRG